MKRYQTGILLVSLTLLFSTSLLDARPGGGARNFGSRGSRSSAPRYSAPPPSQSPYRPSGPSAAPNRTAPPSYTPAPSGGGFMRGLVGGIAGGMIGSMLFRGLGFAGPSGFAGGGGGGGMGFLEILLLCGLGFFAYRWFRNRQGVSTPAQSYSSPSHAYEAAPAADATADSPSDADPVTVLRRYDGAFDLGRFQEARVEDFFRVQKAYSGRDLSGIQGKLTPELYWQLEQESARLRAQNRVNRVEDIHVAQSEVTEAWQETGREYATLKVRARALDYVLDEKTGELISGNKEHPAAFEEYWTFVREIGFAASDKEWKLAAIENSAHPA